MEGKTACTVLQEMLVRMGQTPQYEMVAQSGPPHSVTFEYRCLALGVVATHSAASKKEAKQGAARQLLRQLAAKGMNVPQQFAVGPAPSSNPLEPSRTPTPGRNAVALLHDLCEEYGLGGAEYELIGDTGPPHMRLFTVRVQVGAHSRTAAAGNKKTARALAAHQLYQYLKENLARLTGEIDEEAALARMHEKAMERYCEIKDTAPRPLLGQKIADYHLGIKAAHALRKPPRTRCRGRKLLIAVADYHLGIKAVHDPEAVEKAREALKVGAKDPGAAVAEVAKVLGLELSWRGESPMLLSLHPTAPPLLFAGLTPQRASNIAYRYFTIALQ